MKITKASIKAAITAIIDRELGYATGAYSVAILTIILIAILGAFGYIN